MILKTIDIAIITIGLLAGVSMFILKDINLVAGAIAAISGLLGLHKHLENKTPGAAGPPVH